MGEKISVIVPIYKVEQYLNRCVDSIINQTYTNLEIILVDDGSPDNCPKICDEYAKIDDRIKVIHKENGGLSDARNAGLEIATGDYIAFVDSDDWVHKDMYRILYENIIKNKADIAECSTKKVEEYEEDFNLKEEFEVNIYSKEKSMKALIHEDIVQQTVWNKLYKRELVDDLLFEKGKFHEDEFWTYKVIDRCNCLVHIDIEMYYYFQRQDSIMGQDYSIKRLDALEGRYNRYLYIKQKYPVFIYEAKLNLFYLCIYYLQQALKSVDKSQYKRSYDIIKKYIKNINFNIKDYKKMKFREFMWFFISKISLKKCCEIRNYLNIGV